MSRRPAGTASSGAPSRRRVPAVALSRPATMRRSVVLPQPEGPRSVRTRPLDARKETPSRARAPPSKTFVIPSPTSSPLTAASPLHRAARQAARDAPLEDEDEEDERSRRDDDGRRELPPGDLEQGRAARRSRCPAVTVLRASRVMNVRASMNSFHEKMKTRTAAVTADGATSGSWMRRSALQGARGRPAPRPRRSRAGSARKPASRIQAASGRFRSAYGTISASGLFSQPRARTAA